MKATKTSEVSSKGVVYIIKLSSNDCNVITIVVLIISIVQITITMSIKLIYDCWRMLLNLCWS